MAELNSTPQKSGSGHKRKKANLRIDLTAMVDLAFLLITFFIMTTTLAKPKAMDLVMPTDDINDPTKVPASRSLTICLGKNNTIMWYLGELSNPIIPPTITSFDKEGLRKALIDNKKQIYDKYHKDMIVLVKPAVHSVYSNLVSTLDELNITGTQIYSIVDIAQPDIDALKQKAIY